MKRSVVVLIVAVILAATLVACGGSSGVVNHYLFAANNGTLNGTGTISVFKLTRTTGALALSSTESIANNDTPQTLAITGDGKFLYAAATNGTVESFQVTSDGLLPIVGGTIALTNGCAFGLAISPNNKYLYVPDACNKKVWAYSIGTDGLLTAITNSPFSSPNFDDDQSAAVDRSNTYLYVANNTDGKISGFKIGTDGSLTEVSGSPFALTQGTRSIIASRNTDVLYVADNVANTVVALKIDTQAGGLTQVSGSPYAAGEGTGTVVLSPNGSYLFATNYLANNVSVYQVSGDGTLAPASGSPVATAGIHPNGVVVDPGNRYVYVSTFSNPGAVEGFSIGSAGALTALTGSPFAAGPYTAGLQVSK